MVKKVYRVKRIYTDANVLRAARELIVSGKRTTICGSLDEISIGSVQQKTALKRWIMKMLDGASTYAGWLAKHDPARFQACLGKRGGFQDGRLEWLDWMIEQCDKEIGYGAP